MTTPAPGAARRDPRQRAGTGLAPQASRRTDCGHGYAHDSTRRALRSRGIRHVIPERSDQVARWTAKGSLGGRPPAFDRAIYRKRSVVEGCFNRLKQWRDLATRYAKRASLYQASLVLVAVIIWFP
ncbi:transposase [Micromonospora aurantiaca]|uniref:transposase n=1 Tax=Micromonospora TaxID=1873 RepID=UPI0033C424B5